jgi:Bacterial regulatory helix-turn-helix protein, lysR family
MRLVSPLPFPGRIPRNTVSLTTTAPPMRYDPTRLDLFLTVAQERNLALGARLRHLAVSAVSKRVSALEEQAARLR